jgi:hypothetical protein
MSKSNLGYTYVRGQRGGRFLYDKHTDNYIVACCRNRRNVWEIWKWTPAGGNRWQNNYTLVQSFSRLKPALTALKLILVATDGK